MKTNLKNILKPNVWNVIITLAYIFFSWLPIFKIQVWCAIAPCPLFRVSLLHFFGVGGFWPWLLTAILVYLLVSFIYFKLKILKHDKG